MPDHETQPLPNTEFIIDFERLFENMTPGIVVHDAEGEIIYANRSAETLLGLTVDEITGRTAVDPRWRIIKPNGSVFPTEELPVMRSLQTQKAVKNVTMGIILDDGKQRWLSVSTRPLFREQRFTGVEVSFINITTQIEDARRNLEAEVAKQRVQIMADFIRDAAHEFRTPLAIILTKAHILRKKYEDTLADSREIDMIESQVEDITQLVTNLGLLVRLDERSNWTMGVVKVHRLLRDIIPRYEYKFAGTLTTDFVTTDVTVFAHESTLATAIEKVMDNALQFTPDDGTIIIRTRIQDFQLLVDIVDNGVGMSEATLARATERFYPPSHARTHRGFGLGLAIADRIMQMHSNNIIIESEQGHGTTVTLPLVLTNASRV